MFKCARRLGSSVLLKREYSVSQRSSEIKVNDPGAGKLPLVPFLQVQVHYLRWIGVRVTTGLQKAIEIRGRQRRKPEDRRVKFCFLYSTFRQ